MPTLSKYTREAVKQTVPSYEEYKKKKLEKIGYHGSYDFVVSTGNGFKYYALVDDEHEKIMFYSEVNTFSSSKHNRVTSKQNLLWKDKSISSDTVIWAFGQILDDHGMIISDEYQSIGGKEFWKKLFKKYSNSRYFEVGHLDITNKKLIPYNISEDFEKEFDDFYKGMNEYTSLYIRKKD